MFHIDVLGSKLAILAATAFQSSEVSLFVRTGLFFYSVLCLFSLLIALLGVFLRSLCLSAYFFTTCHFSNTRPQTLKSLNVSLSLLRTDSFNLTAVFYGPQLSLTVCFPCHASLHILNAPHFLGSSRFPYNCKPPAPNVPGSSPVADSV